MAKIKVINDGSEQFLNPFIGPGNNSEFPNSTNLFNTGNFTITTNLNNRVVKNFDNKLSAFSQPITLETLKVDDISKLTTISEVSQSLILNIDKKNLNNYALYGSLTDRIVSSVNNIVSKWPGSIYVSNTDSTGTFYYNIYNYSYDSLSNTSNFNIPSFLVQNNYGLTYVSNSQHILNDTSLKNLNYSYNKYVLFDTTTNKQYALTDFIGPYQNNSGFLNVTVKGNPFTGATINGGTDAALYHIKPNNDEFTYFYNSLDSFEKYILSLDTSPKYTLTAKVPVVNDDDEYYFLDKLYTWPVSDKYNIDISGTKFQKYYNSLLDLSDAYDKFKSDVVYRMFMPSSVKDSDLTDNLKSRQFSRILGRELDEIRAFIDGLTYINNVSYDKVENVPDKLVKNLAKTMGWGNFNIIEVDDLFASIFDTSVSSNVNGISTTPHQLDIDMWRNILMNTAWLFKSKGTRKAIEAIFAFIGVPNCFIEINEHIYTVSGKINPNTVNLDNIFPLNTQLTRLPYDSDGYPVASNEISDFYFQKAGNTDGGQEYINIYRNLGFNVTKTIDNKKSWVYSLTAQSRFDDFTDIQTNYSIESSKLVINTKELSVTLDPIKAIECDIYSYNYSNNYPISDTYKPIPYPQRLSNFFAVSGLTFSEYVNEVYSTFVNASDRKTSDDGRGGGYPSLTKLYYDYLNRSLSEGGIQSNEYDLRKVFNYVKKFQNYITKFFDQLAPATVIFEQQGIKIRNTIFTPQKFVYKHGIDVSSEFEVKQPQFVSDSMNLNAIKSSDVILPVESTIKLWESNGSYNFNGANGSNETIFNTKTIIRPRDRWESSILSINIPGFYMTGATKIVSGITNSSVYYYDDNTVGKNTFFNMTGDTSCLSATTNPCLFSYNIYKYIPTITGFTGTSNYTKNIPSSYFTGGTFSFNDIIPKSNLEGDTEYLIKGYFTNKINAPTADTITFGNVLDQYGIYDKYIYPANPGEYEFFFDYTKYSGYTGSVISSLSVIEGSTWNTYDSLNDWYFVSVNNPEKPSLIGLDDNTVNNPNNSFYYYETVSLNGSNEILTTYTPLGDIQLNVNGNSLMKGLEYQLKTGLPSFLTNRVYSLLVSGFTPTDIITVAYITNGGDYAVKNDTELITFIPSGTTQVLPYEILFNTSTNLYEFFLTQDVTGGTNNVQVVYNGSSLAPNVDYQLSISNNKKIVFPSLNISLTDVISVYYVIGATPVLVTFPITTNPFTFNWTIPSLITTQVGYFTLEFSNINDTGFTGLTSSAITSYVTGSNQYSINADFTTAPFNTLLPGTVYNVRVKSTKRYTCITTDVIETYNYSDLKRIKTPL